MSRTLRGLPVIITSISIEPVLTSIPTSESETVIILMALFASSTVTSFRRNALARDSANRIKASNCRGVINRRICPTALRPHLKIELVQLLDRIRSQDRIDPFRIADVLFEKIRRERSLRIGKSLVKRENMLGHSRVRLLLRHILQNKDQIKSRKYRNRQVDVLTHVSMRLIPSQ